MLLIDDILLFPSRGLLFVLREINSAVQQEVAGETEAIRTELRELYMTLETGRITEEQFDAREKELLDRLDAIEEPAEPTESNSTTAEK